MAQLPKPLTPQASALHRFGAELRQWRLRRDLSQDALGLRVHASGDLVAKIEKAQRWPAAGFAERCDAVLQANGAIVGLLPYVELERQRRRQYARQSSVSAADGRLPEVFASALPGATLASAVTGKVDRHTLCLPSGRLLVPTSVDAWLSASVVRDGGGLVASALPVRVARPGDLLIVRDPDDSGDRARFYAADARCRAAQTGNEVLIPAAYLLDDFTIGLLWATRALDDALVDDDRPLADALGAVPVTALTDDAGTVVANDLTVASQAWLGSYACAKFISAHLDASSGPPMFWTREQRGEEAAAWLLFAHKGDYLRALRGRFSDRPTVMDRVFCLPEATAVTGPRAERVLLLLAAALMEAMGVAVHACTDSDYSTVEGFVLTPDGTVIVANWLRDDRVWHADVIGGRRTVGSYRDAIGFGRAHSILSAVTPTGRLRRLADYLQVDWAWLTTRAAQMSASGVEDLVRPRSRLLSTSGIEIACRFLAGQPGVTAEAARPPA
jgi:transcriptional regulator with XRE-family HTH domain